MQMEKILNLDYHKDRWTESNLSPKELIAFEDDIISHWENGEIRGPIHLSNGNEEQLIKIIKHITNELEWSECVSVSTIDYRNSKAKYVDRFFEGTEIVNNPKK